MKKIVGISSFFCKVLVVLILFLPAAAISEEMPVLSLITPESKVDREYLGLETQPQEVFHIADIKADVLVLELFSMYCPYCQAEAPLVNELHELAIAKKSEGVTIKMLGLGASNTEFEVQQFKNVYQLMFPVLPDKSLEMYKQLKGEGTPGFIVVRLKDGEKPQIVHRRSGGFESAESFMETLLETSGYK